MKKPSQQDDDGCLGCMLLIMAAPCVAWFLLFMMKQIVKLIAE